MAWPILDTWGGTMKARRGAPTVGGEPAGVIYDLIESLPIVIGDDDSIDFERHFCDEHAAQFRRAFERVELDAMAGIEACPCPEEHGPMEPGEWRFMVIHTMADQARLKLGERDPHRFWC
jgi:hypothetical protein